MSGFGRIIAALRPATLVAGGAFAVHELSYVAGYGGGASLALRDHSYLAGLLPALAVLVALTLLATVEGGLAGQRTLRASPLTRILTYAAAIVAIFAVQETAESLLAGGGPAQIAALLAHGGVAAVPLALGFGFLAWLAARGLEAVEGCLVARFAQPVHRARRSTRRPRRAPAFALPVLAACAAARAPPSI